MVYDIAIIGAGIIGTFIGRELSQYNLKVVILEKDNDVANGTTKANSAIVHAGYDAEAGSLKAKFNVLSNPMFDRICKELSVPFKRIGSLVVAFDDEDMEVVNKLYANGVKLNIPGLEIIDGEAARQMDKSLSKDIIAALHAPTAGIVSPYELAIALAENAVENGVELKLNNEVLDIKKEDDIYKIITSDGEVQAKYVINAAGVYADKINNMVASESFRIIPRRGQYYVLDKRAGSIVNKVIFQCPTSMGKGVLVAPTVHGNILVGPDSEDIEDKESKETTAEGMEYVKQCASRAVDNVPLNKVITSFAGLRAEATGGDFIIEESQESKGFINVAGIKSPGLASSPGIAKYVVEIIRGIVGRLEEKEDYNPIRREVIRFDELSDEEKAEVIKKDPRYGRVICRCENITEGEIVDAIHRKAGAITVDGVKRRVRPGMGRCQGGFCGPRVMEILSRELKKDIKNVVKSNKGSFIITGETKE